MNTSINSRTGRRLPGKQMLMFLASLLVGGAGVYLAKQYIEEKVAYYKEQLEQTEDMVQVVVPNRSLKRGDILLANDLSIREIPEKYADSNTVNGSNYDKAVGQRIDFDIDEGRPLLWAHLEGGLTPTFSGKVGNGLRALTVRVDEVNSISGFLQPNDQVDLLLSYGSGAAHQVLPLIQRLVVIATGVQTYIDKGATAQPRQFSTITVHVDPVDAQKITLAQQVGRPTAMLRNPEDQTSLEEAPLTVSQLLKLPEPNKAIASRPSKVQSVRKEPMPPRIEYIIGGQ